MEHSAAVAGSQVFYPSKNSNLRKQSAGLWFGVLLYAAIRLFTAGDIAAELSSSSFWLFIGVMVAICFAVQAYLSSQANPNTPLATLTVTALESDRFGSKVQSLPWEEVETVSVMRYQGQTYLQFVIKENSPIHEQRSFWSFGNKIQLPLATLGEAEQVKLLDAVNAHLQRVQGSNPEQPFHNELKEEAELNQKLNALGPTPWLTYGLIALNIAIWIIVSLGSGNLMQTPADKLLAAGGNAASAVQNGEWWRLLSATFLHSGFMHVAMNMLGLYSVGVMLERIYGQRQFAIIYFGAGLIGSALSLSYAAQNAVSVGASGAVFGITGALIIALFQHRDTLPKAMGKNNIGGLVFFILYSLLQGFTHAGIDNAAHIGGLVGGCVLAFVLPERFDMDSYLRTHVSRALTALVVILVSVTALAFTAPRASVDQQRMLAGKSMLQEGFKDFDAAIKLLKQEEEDVKAGKLTEREADDRSRTILAPRFQEAENKLSAVVLSPNDPLTALHRDTLAITRLLRESLAMESIYQHGSDKPEPADPTRAKQIEVELNAAFESLKQTITDAKNKAADRKKP